MPSKDVITNAQGVEPVRYVMPDNLLAPAGVNASVSGLPTLQVIVTSEVGASTEIIVTLQATAVTAGGDLGQPIFSVVDEHENAIAFYRVTFTVTAAGGTVDGGGETTVETALPPASTTIRSDVEGGTGCRGEHDRAVGGGPAECRGDADDGVATEGCHSSLRDRSGVME